MLARSMVSPTRGRPFSGLAATLVGSLSLMLISCGVLVAQQEDSDEANARWSTQRPQVMDASGEAEGEASREKFRALPGFQVELLYSVPRDTQGSWVSLTFDDQGRLLVSDQGKQGLFRVSVPKIGSDEETKVERLSLPITSAQGMLHAFGKLYLSVNGGPGSGFYVAEDSNGDDELDAVRKIRAFKGGGEHGPHAVRLAPDGKSLYVICGNHTDPTEFDSTRILSNWGEDLLLPRQWDARGHAAGRLAPGGWIARTDPEGEQWELISSGYRNAYDFDFSAEGELFAYDADMEWDLGSPWYRPTRLTHAVSGSEFGWRSGTGKWPSYYPDSLPAVVDIGPGSPVGVTFGTGAKFPAKYQRAAYLLDWTFGTIYAVHLQPKGSSYEGEKEEFLSRAALPLTDAEVGPDGALYFAVGGRNTQSALYRVTYVGDASTEQAGPRDDTEQQALRKIRHKLEAMHPSLESPSPKVDVDFAWKHLGHEDRFIRYAARVALEHVMAKGDRDPNQWAAELTDADAVTKTHAVIGLARAASQRWSEQPQLAQLRGQLLGALNGIEFESLQESQKVDLLRAYALVFIRTGEPTREQASDVIAKLEPHFPCDVLNVDRELARVLVYLNAPSAVQQSLALMYKEYPTEPGKAEQLLSRNPSYGGTIAKMLANQPELQKLHYAFILRNMRYGWTLEERRQYVAWLNKERQKSGGASYQGFIDNIKKEAFENMSEAEREALQSEELPVVSGEDLPKPAGPGKAYTTDDILSLVSEGITGRDFQRGKRAFAAARCVVCHRFDGNGGATGPDLTSVVSRFSMKDLAESLIEPSKTVSDQYRAMMIETSDGKVLTGRIVGETETELTVQTNPEDATKTATIAKDSIELQEPSPSSLMPEKLLDSLNEDEVLDLLAYLLSRGNENDLMFAKP